MFWIKLHTVDFKTYYKGNSAKFWLLYVDGYHLIKIYRQYWSCITHIFLNLYYYIKISALGIESFVTLGTWIYLNLHVPIKAPCQIWMHSHPRLVRRERTFFISLPYISKLNACFLEIPYLPSRELKWKSWTSMPQLRFYKQFNAFR